MKKIICMLLAALLLLTGCQTGNPSQTTSAPTETTVAPAESTAPPQETTVPESGSVIGTEAPGSAIDFTNPGKLRVQYEGSRSSVKYITSPEELPQEDVFAMYDEAFFAEHALILVVETVNSGSVQLEIDSIRLEGDTASVVLKRTMLGEVGTADMATWMLWAEVSRELDYAWTLENSTNLPGGEKY